MKTIRMPSTEQQQRLTNQFKQQLHLNRARAKGMCLFIAALIRARTVNLSEVAVAMATNASTESNYKRLQRFLKEVFLDPDAFARLMGQLIPVDDKWVLTLDRTNWKFGKTNINILLLGVACNGASFPLMFRILAKQGNSNTRERIELISRFLALFGADKIQSLTADREFIGKDWFQWLVANDIPFVIRIRENFSTSSAGGNRIKAKDLFKGLSRRGSWKIREKRHLCGASLHLFGRKSRKGELLILASNVSLQDIREEYRHRWTIETLFGFLKTKGFNLESTHVTKPGRLMNLMMVLSLAFSWCYLVGQKTSNAKPLQNKKHGRKVCSLFRFGLDLLRRALLGTDGRMGSFEISKYFRTLTGCHQQRPTITPG